MTKKEINEGIKVLKIEINEIYVKAEKIKWKYINENSDFISKKENEILRLENELREINKEKNKNKKFFKACGDNGSENNRGMEIIKETDNLVLCYQKGYSSVISQVSGLVYSNPAFIIFKKGKVNQYMEDNYTGGVWEIEYKRGERKQALQKAIEKQKDLDERISEGGKDVN